MGYVRVKIHEHGGGTALVLGEAARWVAANDTAAKVSRKNNDIREKVNAAVTLLAGGTEIGLHKATQ